MPEQAANISLFNFVAVVILSGLWLYVSSLINMDASRVRLERQMWSGVMLTSGILGIVAWLLIPNGWAGNLIFLVLIAMPTSVYLLYRNSKVDPSQQVFTREWFARRKEIKELSKAPLEAKIRIYGKDGRPIFLDMESGDHGYLIRQHNFVQDFFFDVARRRAAEVEVAPVDAEFAGVRYLIDGVATSCPPIPLEQADSIIQYVKQYGGADANERKKPQEGKIAIDIAEKPVDIEFTTTPTKGGQKARLKITSELVQTDLDSLGMDKRTLKYVEKMKDAPGIFMVSSLPKCGSTSTLYSIVRKQDPYMKLITTVEAKPSMDIDNITQNIYESAETLNKILATSIRHDPNYIMLDKCLDRETVKLIGEFVSEKKQLLLEMKAYDSFAALSKFLSTGANPGWLRGVMGQCLVRKLCTSCREAFRPSSEMLEKIGLRGAKVQTLYRPPTQKQADSKMDIVECSICGGTGYLGRMGIYEFLEITSETLQLIQQKASMSQIKAAAKKSGMRTIKENALMLVAHGATSVNEIVRITKLLNEAAQKGKSK
ncbi:MAG: Flp pilus assembly complex ATPase component TadA [Phycisphaerae bacterium]|nr:Flp pilus assembly complex ATPase component TadA [Phycisphaerae bacterium]